MVFYPERGEVSYSRVEFKVVRLLAALRKKIEDYRDPRSTRDFRNCFDIPSIARVLRWTPIH